MKKKMIVVLTGVALTMLVPVISACSSPVIQPTTVEAQVINAPLLFANNCSICHGANRQGTAIGPAVTQAALVLLTEADLVAKISTHQTGVGLTPAEVAALATYLKTTP